MSDVVKIDGWLGRNSAVAVGLTSAHDNHGNSISGFRMQCAGKEPQLLNPVDWMNVMDGISGSPLRFDGVVPMTGDHPSPLQQFCRSGGVLSFFQR